MNAQTKSTRKTSKPTPAQQLDAEITQRNTANNETLVSALPALIARHPRIEWQIVKNYLDRNGRIMVDRDGTR